MSNKDIGKMIKKYRKLQNLSVIELAQKAKLHRNTIYKIESGQRIPNVNTLKKVALALDIPPSVLIN